MGRPRLRGLLLCEDRGHKRFFLKLLQGFFARGRLRVESIPNTKGAGDAFVLQKYAGAVALARSNRHENYALVVAVDGDRFKMQERLRRLDEKLEEARLHKRRPTDRIAIFVPTRNIETWELWLCGARDVDEERDFKQRLRAAERQGEASVKSAVEAWFKDLAPEEKKHEERILPALAAGRLEIRRLKPQ